MRPHGSHGEDAAEASHNRASFESYNTGSFSLEAEPTIPPVTDRSVLESTPGENQSAAWGWARKWLCSCKKAPGDVEAPSATTKPDLRASGVQAFMEVRQSRFLQRFDNPELERRYSRQPSTMHLLPILAVYIAFVLVWAVALYMHRDMVGEASVTRQLAVLLPVLAAIICILMFVRGRDKLPIHVKNRLLQVVAIFAGGLLIWVEWEFCEAHKANVSRGFDAAEGHSGPRDLEDGMRNAYMLYHAESTAFLLSLLLVCNFANANFNPSQVIVMSVTAVVMVTGMALLPYKGLAESSVLLLVLKILGMAGLLTYTGIENEKGRRERFLYLEQYIQQHDDRHLNFVDHQMKQKFAGSYMLVEQLLDVLEAGPDSVAENHEELVMMTETVLKELRRGKELCYQMTLQRQLVAGTYTPRPVRLFLKHELTGWCGPGCVIHVGFDVPEELMVDWNLYQHILDNMRSNARKYGGQGVIKVIVYLDDKELVVELRNPPGEDQDFHVANKTDFAALVRGKGQAEMGRPGPSGGPMGSGPMGSFTGVNSVYQTGDQSNHMGLDIVALCAKCIGARIDISFTPHETIFEMRQTLETMAIPATSSSGNTPRNSDISSYQGLGRAISGVPAEYTGVSPRSSRQSGSTVMTTGTGISTNGTGSSLWHGGRSANVSAVSATSTGTGMSQRGRESPSGIPRGSPLGKGPPAPAKSLSLNTINLHIRKKIDQSSRAGSGGAQHGQLSKSRSWGASAKRRWAPSADGDGSLDDGSIHNRRSSPGGYEHSYWSHEGSPYTGTSWHGRGPSPLWHHMHGHPKEGGGSRGSSMAVSPLRVSPQARHQQAAAQRMRRRANRARGFVSKPLHTSRSLPVNFDLQALLDQFNQTGAGKGDVGAAPKPPRTRGPRTSTPGSKPRADSLSAMRESRDLSFKYLSMQRQASQGGSEAGEGEAKELQPPSRSSDGQLLGFGPLQERREGRTSDTGSVGTATTGGSLSGMSGVSAPEGLTVTTAGAGASPGQHDTYGDLVTTPSTGKYSSLSAGAGGATIYSHTRGSSREDINKTDRVAEYVSSSAHLVEAGSMDGPPPGLLYSVLDDSALIRMACKRLVSKVLEGHPDSEVLGATDAEILGFVEHVMTLPRQPDVILLDQNLDSPTTPSLCVTKGTEVMKSLFRRGFTGPIVIRSANDSPKHEAEFLAEGASALISKSAPQSVVKAKLGQVWAAHAAKRRPVEGRFARSDSAVTRTKNIIHLFSQTPRVNMREQAMEIGIPEGGEQLIAPPPAVGGGLRSQRSSGSSFEFPSASGSRLAEVSKPVVSEELWQPAPASPDK